MNFKKTINFSLWCDFIERDFLENEFSSLIEAKTIHGATSNPAIFEQSLSNSDAYTQQIMMLQANDEKRIYEELAITDIKRAANILAPLYENDSDDGFISIEVDPTLCDDAMATIEEGTRLFAAIGYSNVMIKIPATEAGYVAMENLTAMGINVNATLIFTIPFQALLWHFLILDSTFDLFSPQIPLLCLYNDKIFLRDILFISKILYIFLKSKFSSAINSKIPKEP